MKFSCTGEVSQSVFKKKVRVCSFIEQNLLQQQEGTVLDAYDAEVHFCPILMDDNLIQYYPARSNTDKKEKVFYCCPQLNYRLFKSGSFEDQLGNCIDELLLADKPLKTLGATPEQRAAYREILESIRQM
jgi:hypothetical protein